MTKLDERELENRLRLVFVAVAEQVPLGAGSADGLSQYPVEQGEPQERPYSHLRLLVAAVVGVALLVGAVALAAAHSGTTGDSANVPIAAAPATQTDSDGLVWPNGGPPWDDGQQAAWEESYGLQMATIGRTVGFVRSADLVRLEHAGPLAAIPIRALDPRNLPTVGSPIGVHTKSGNFDMATAIARGFVLLDSETSTATTAAP